MWLRVEDVGRPGVLIQFGQVGGEMLGNLAGNIAVDGCADTTEVRSGVVEKHWVGGAAETGGGAWPEAVAVLEAADGEDGEKAAGKLLHFY